MTRLPSDSFLPSGALDTEQQQQYQQQYQQQQHLNMPLAGLVGGHSSSSVISPLSLPGAVHYFDPAPRPSVTSHPNTFANHTYPHLDGTSRDPPQAQPATFFSPHLTPIPSHAQRQLQFQRQPQQRSASLSPTRRSPAGRLYTMDAKRTTDADLSPRITGVSVPVDTISGTGSGVVTIRRPAMPRTFSSETAPVESQSSCLEAKMRQAWDHERRALQENRDRAEEVYRDTIDALRHEHSRDHAHWEAEKYTLQAQIMQLQNRLQEFEGRGSEASLRGGGSDSARSESALFHRGPSQMSPLRQPDMSPFIPREPLSMDAVAVMDHEQPSKVIDVQEYHKDLEGIHLKENAVKKATFTDTPTSSGSKPSSGNVSPPHFLEERRQTARERSLQAFKADAQSRLTIHAGHTPTVSLSIASTGASNTVVSSGSNTPTLTSGDGAMSENDNNRESSEPAEPVPTGQDEEDYAPAILEPSDEDPELKGPLTLRNIPAKDEIFLKRLSDKLQKVGSGGEDATPTCLRHSDDEDDEAEPSAAAAEGDTEGVESVDSVDSAGSVEGVEEHIPLKIKKTSNFGKPLGSL